MAQVIGKIILIGYLNKSSEKINRQMQHDTGASAGIAPRFTKLRTDASALLAINEGAYVIREFKDGQYFVKAHTQMEVQLGDIVVSGKGVLCAAEFLLGGRVGINPGAAVCFTSERQVRELHQKSVILRQGGVWARSSQLKEPLEIQTNGGVFGIKG